MGALHGFAGRQAGDFRHVADELDAGHLRDKGIALRHIADHGAQPANVGANVIAEDTGRPAEGRIKTQQSIEQGRFAGAVRPKQPNAQPSQ